MTLFEFRYNLEHRLFPRYYFEDTPAFFAALLGNEDEDSEGVDNYLFEMVSDISDKCDFALPYTADQYGVELREIDDNTFMCKISLPEPEESPLCSRVYLILSGDYSNQRYFSVELMEIRRKRKCYCLCEWSSTGHHNYGEAPENVEQLERKIVDLGYQNRNTDEPILTTMQNN